MTKIIEKMGKIKFDFRWIIGVLMVIVYLAMGGLLCFSGLFVEDYSPAIRYTVGGVLLGYGVFRAFRLIQATEKSDE